MKRIAQIGTFDVENFGDLLFPFVLEKKLGRDYKIDLFSPNGGKMCFSDKTVYAIEDLEKKIEKEKYDAIIIGGGDLIRTDKRICITSSVYELSSIPSLSLWMFPIIIAKKYKIPVIFNSVGVPNDFKYDEIQIIKEILTKVDYLVVRDKEAQKTIESVGIETVKLVPDSVITISDIISFEELDNIYNNLIKKGIVPKIDNYIVFQHNSRFTNNSSYYKKMIESLREIASYEKILFMPIGYVHDDDKILKKIYDEKINNTSIIDLKYKLSPIEMISILSHSSGYIGTSMHGAVVSYSYGKPFLILNVMNSKKLHGFASISNNYELDVNDINNLIYVYNKYFRRKKSSNLNDVKKIINKNFDNIKKIISCNKGESYTFDFINFISKIYETPKIIGNYCDDINNIINRNVFVWKSEDEFYQLETDLKDLFINISCHKNVLISCYNFEILDNDIIMYDNKIISLKNKYFHIKVKNNKIQCKIEIIDDDCFQSIILNFLDKRNKVLNEYKYLEKKYIDLLKK